MLDLRPEVRKFMDAAETLLSPVLLATPLNDDERGMIAAYVESLGRTVISNSECGTNPISSSQAGLFAT